MILFALLACTTETPDAETLDRPTPDPTDEGGDDGHDGNDGDDGDDGDDGGSDAYPLTDGETWTVTGRSFTHDPCGAADWVSHGEVGNQVTLLDDGGGKFTMAGEEPPDDQCQLDGWSYDCDSRTDEDTTPQDYGLDAIIVFDALVYGDFVDEASMTMSADVVLNCEGADCGVVEAIVGGSACELTLQMDLARD